MNRYQFQGCQLGILKSLVETHQKQLRDLKKKSEVDNKLGGSFYYLPHQGICKSKNVPVNIYIAILLMNSCVSIGIIISQ